ncbi:hypothetical protein TIFTF001_031224 [Ficus carica]|uniref:Uncharacterized protein n=1 Tax=Ficus carica TaxID=3494 RepID=A0AA88DUN9_FICCA|nr:hypothetical protein TIFTF001_031224 [Ficus carica]
MTEEERADVHGMHSHSESDHLCSFRQKRRCKDPYENPSYRPLPEGIDRLGGQGNFIAYHDDNETEIWHPCFLRPSGVPVLNGDVPRNPHIGRVIKQALDTPTLIHWQFQYS